MGLDREDRNNAALIKVTLRDPLASIRDDDPRSAALPRPEHAT